MITKRLLLIVLFISTIFTMNTKAYNTVKQVDLKRYMGLWYEVARFENSFEKDLVGVTARYTLKPDGKIEVINSGRVKTLDGRLKSTKGKAKQPDPNKPGELKVSFFLWFYANDDILLLDQKNYSYALVGSGSGYLWILSRTPELDKATLKKITDYAKSIGYDISKLYFTPQIK